MIYDFLVIGKGVAGLSFALKSAQLGSVCIISKGGKQESSSYYAQGGIAVAMNKNDIPKNHYEDTLAVGGDLCNKEAVKILCHEGVDRIKELINMGMKFSSTQHNELLFNIEAGHSLNRIVHVNDATGKYLYDFLERKVQEHSNITFINDAFSIDLITEHIIDSNLDIKNCYGSYIFNTQTSSVSTILSKYTILCTGGISSVFQTSTNPTSSTGDGIAMAYRAGCRIQNLEFIQFHPTALFLENQPPFLITEALRGFGAKLLTPNKKKFMHLYHKKEELAPRDILSRSIDFEMKKNAYSYVLLDCSFKSKQSIINKFPNIYYTLKNKYHIDITKEPIPVKPASHYTCGGVLVDLNSQTDIQYLYAIGEVASTGVHGANRLASNSLLEALVYAHRAIEFIKKKKVKRNTKLFKKIPHWDHKIGDHILQASQTKHDKQELQTIMENYVGIVRSNQGLKIALKRVDIIYSQVKNTYKKFQPSLALLELRNLVLNAQLIIRSAYLRKESRGLHYNIDYPNLKKRKQNTILKPSIYKQYVQ